MLFSLLAVPGAAAGVPVDGPVGSVEDVAGGPPASAGAGGGTAAAAPSEKPSSSGSSGDTGGSGKSSGSSGASESGKSSGSSGASDSGRSSDGRGHGADDERGPPGDDDRGPPGVDDRGPPPRAGDDPRNGGPSVEVSTGSPDVPGQGPPFDPAAGRSDGANPTSVVEVAVEGARKGDAVSMDVSPTVVEDDAVAFDGVSVAVKRDGDFTMRVTNSRLADSPEFEPEAAAETLGRIRLDHSITNEEVEDVSYEFRVSKERLREAGTDAEQVALYQHADGEWSELPTDVVGETETHYLLSADSPGMSEFAVGAKRPAFDTYWADVDARSVDAGTTVTVSGRVTNHGGADGVYDARLTVDGETVAVKSVTVAAGGTRQVNFRTTLDRPGARRLSIDGVAAGDVTVTEGRPPAESSDTSVDRSLTVAIDRVLDVGRGLGVAPRPAADGR